VIGEILAKAANGSTNEMLFSWQRNFARMVEEVLV